MAKIKGKIISENRGSGRSGHSLPEMHSIVVQVDMDGLNLIEKIIPHLENTSIRLSRSLINSEKKTLQKIIDKQNGWSISDFSPAGELEDKVVYIPKVLPKQKLLNLDLPQAIGNTNHFLDIILESTTEAFILVDKSLRILSFNRTFDILYKKFFNINVRVGDDIVRYAQPENRAILPGLYDRIFAGGEENYHLELEKPEGKVYIDLAYQPARNSSGEIVGAFVNCKDVTELIKNREEILLSERRYRTLVEHGSDAIAILGADGATKYVSPSIEMVLGYSEEEAMQMSIFEIVHPDSREEILGSLQKAMENPGLAVTGSVARVKHKSGEWRWYEATITNMLHDPLINGIVDNFRDVTERVEESLKREETEKRLKAAQTIAKLGYWEHDLVTDQLNWSEEVFKFFDLDQNNSVADYDYLISRLYPADLDDYDSFNNRVSHTDGEHEHTHRVILEDGSIKYLQEKAKRTIDHSGRTIKIGGTIQDVTDLKQTEEALRSSEAQMNNIFNNALDAVVVIDNDGIIANWNPMAEKIFGWKAEEAIGKNMQNTIIPSSHRKALKRGMAHYAKTGHGPILNTIIETTALRKDGTEIHVSLGISPTQIFGEEYFLGFISDISERKEMERQKEFEKRDKEALINSTEDFIWSVDSKFNLIAANRSFLKSMYSQTGKHLVQGDNLLMSDFEYEFLKLWQNLYNRALSGESVQLDIRTNEPSEKDPTWFSTSIHPIEIENEIAGVACYSRDITNIKRYQKELLEANEKLNTAQKIAKLGYWEVDAKSMEIYWTDQVYSIWEIDKEKQPISFDFFLNSIHPDDIKAFLKARKNSIKNSLPFDAEHRIILQNGNIKWVREKGTMEKDGADNTVGFEGTIQDITDQKLNELELTHRNRFIETALDNLPIGIAVNRIDNQETTLTNKRFCEIYGWPEEELINVVSFFGKVYADPETRASIAERISRDMESRDPERMNWEGIEITTQTGSKKIVNAKNIPLYDQNLMISTVVDVTEKFAAERELKESNLRFELSGKASFDAIWDWDIDKKTILWGEAFEKNFGHNFPDDISDVKEWESMIHPDDMDMVKDGLNAALTDITSEVWLSEYRLKKADGEYAFVSDRGYKLRDKNNRVYRMIGAIQDISAQKNYESQLIRLNEQLNERAHLLSISNAELEQFAYVASHDLQEPLRMVTSFLTQLQKKYENELDDRAHQYIHFATDGASRMRQIILDLLAYSRIGREKELPKSVDLNNTLRDVLLLNDSVIKENEANIYFENLPVIHGYATPLFQLFQNLIANAIRYRKKEESPVIEIRYTEYKTHWQFSISDNGIGMENRFQKKIFVIFQRLHNKSAYPGTGIGLAICKKIVEVHKGKIWVESELNVGTTFHFTIAKPL